MRRAALGSMLLSLLLLIALPVLLVRNLGIRLPVLPGQPRLAMPIPVDPDISVYRADLKRIVTMPLSQYVEGVVAAEMPASFGDEALKAQAVVARTYVVKRMRLFGGPGLPLRPGADVSTDPLEGQAWTSWEQLAGRIGWWRALQFRRRVQRAEAATQGLIVVYAGEPIDALYFSTSGGSTENAEEVWGQARPYLRAVPSPWDSRSPFYREMLRLSLVELSAKLGFQVKPPKNPGTLFEVIERTPGGRVRLARIGDRVLGGVEIRQRLGLKSAQFEIRYDGAVIIETLGYGHGVGMSQWGAAGMAAQGSSWTEIIEYYYPGTEIRDLFTE